MKNLIALILLVWIPCLLPAQVGINNDNSAPHPSSMLDVKSNSRGLLPPRMTQYELAQIVSPADGLVVYCTDCGTDGEGAFYGFQYGSWRILMTCQPPASPQQGIHTATNDQITWHWSAVPSATGYRWGTGTSFTQALQVGNVTSFAENGLSCNTVYTRYVWAYTACGSSFPVVLNYSTTGSLPPSPMSGVHTATSSEITWNWQPVANAGGYRWNTVNDYASSIDMGTDTIKTETGLTCNTQYVRFVWAYNQCGQSGSTTLNGTTLSCSTMGEPCPGQPFISYGGKNYATILIGTQCWLKENLNIGTRVNGIVAQTNNGILEKYCYNDSEDSCSIYGGLYQWQEAMQYAALPGAQGICPQGWHIPDDSEWTVLSNFLGNPDSVGGKLKETGLTHWASPNTSATNSSYFTALGGGYRRSDNGTYSSIRFGGHFFSSTDTSATHVWKRYLGYNIGTMQRNANLKTNGFSIRCIQDVVLPGRREY